MDAQKRTRAEIMAEYAAGPGLLEQVLAGLPPAGLDASPGGEGWTIRQIVHHIADGDEVWRGFIKRAAGNPSGEFTLKWYWGMPQTAWAEAWAYGERPIEPSLALLRAGRAHVVQLLEHRPGAWEHSLLIRWPRGEEEQVSVGWVVEMQAGHVLGHIEEIQRIRAAHNL